MWILPTYNRPELLRQTIGACRNSEMSTPCHVLVNGGDREAYREMFKTAELPPGWTIEYLPENLGWAQACNYGFDKFPDEPWYGFFYDDMRPVTDNWDKKLLRNVSRGTLASAVNNWHNPPRIQTAIIDGDLAREVGFLTLPETWACYTDDFWERLGTELGNWKICTDIVVETKNPQKGDYEPDDAHATAYQADTFDADRKIWEAFQRDIYPKLRERAREKFEVGAKRAVSLKGQSVFVATPCADGQMAFYYTLSVANMLPLLDKYGIGWTIHVLDKSSLLDYARNRLLANFLKTKATHLLFVDDDMGWPENAIPELMAHDKDVIAAVGITKDEDPENRRFCVDMDPETTKFDSTRGIIRVHQVGTGFMLIKRHVIEKLWRKFSKDAVPAPREAPELGPINWVFEFDKGNPEGWGEDYTFCRRWREMGGEIWVDPSIQLIHAGQYAFTGTYLDYLESRFKDDERSRAA